MKGKVFGIGLNKTGTTTLGECFQILGFDHQGYSLDMFLEYNELGITKGLKSILNRKDSFEDWPWPLMWKELIELYPDAKFILTKRIDAETWYQSQCKHIERYPETSEVNLPIYGTETPVGHREQFVSFYEDFNAKVENYFRQNAPGKLLVVCWEKGDGWVQLCNFLSFPIPKIAFPHANSSEYPMEFKYFWMGKNKLAFKALAKAILKNPAKGIRYYKDLGWIFKNVILKKKPSSKS